MKFLNKRTGAVIDVPCRLDGPDWEEVTEAKKAEPKADDDGFMNVAYALDEELPFI